ncbi:MAG: hypothetical protein COA49_01085 [Bacteroidetes bacterium]|nr:MAG: hypothetical protein COA49_01085 [Bacteroidota bacterium]
MKVLFLSDGLSPFVLGGMQQHSTMFVKYLAPLVDQITLVHCGPVNSNPPDNKSIMSLLGNPNNIEIIGLKFIDRSSFLGHYVRSSKSYSKRAFEVVKDNLSDFDIVYSQGLTGYSFVGKHKNLIANLHGLNMFQPSFSLKERLEKIILRPIARKILLNANFTVSLGGRLTDVLLSVGVKKQEIVTIPNGIEECMVLSQQKLSLIDSIDVEALKIVFIGRGEKGKGFDILISALKCLKRPLVIRIIGGWEEEEGMTHKMIFHGEITSHDRIIEIIDDSDILVLPSLSEGMPTVILEAMARGKAIIATDVGAVSELVDESNGVLISPNNVNELVDAIKNLDLNQINTLGLSSISKVKDFTWERLSQKFVVEFEGKL